MNDFNFIDLAKTLNRTNRDGLDESFKLLGELEKTVSQGDVPQAEAAEMILLDIQGWRHALDLQERFIKEVLVTAEAKQTEKKDMSRNG